MNERKDIDRLQRITRGLIAQQRINRDNIEARCARIEQALLELAETLRRAGIIDEELFPSASETVSARRSADREPKIPA